MKIALFKTSLKENERRVPIYPPHLPRLPKRLRSEMFFEEGYGKAFGYPDSFFMDHGAHLLPRVKLFEDCDVLVLPKPLPEDARAMRPGQVLFGWVHCVQQPDMVQAAIERRITMIAWEAMYQWHGDGTKGMHIFYKNNEIAGYAAILHCLQIRGIDGLYGPRRKVVILSYGSVSRGAIYALHGRGFNNIHVFSRRAAHLVADQNPDVYFGHYFKNSSGALIAANGEGDESPLIDELSGADMVCNCVLQDTDNPIMFVSAPEVARLKERSVIIDVSCDKGMGFPFARPTTFHEPVFLVGKEITYYSVDHTPSYLWDAASREVSRALVPYLADVAAGEGVWATNPTIGRAVEIQNGMIINPKILSFQGRGPDYPYPVRTNTSK